MAEIFSMFNKRATDCVCSMVSNGSVKLWRAVWKPYSRLIVAKVFHHRFLSAGFSAFLTVCMKSNTFRGSYAVWTYGLSSRCRCINQCLWSWMDDHSCFCVSPGVLVLSWYPPGLADDNGEPAEDLVSAVLDAAYRHNLKVKGISTFWVCTSKMCMRETLKQSGERVQGSKKSNESNLFCGLIFNSIFTAYVKLSKEITSTLLYLHLVLVWV